jgi:hypothetical protein
MTTLRPSNLTTKYLPAHQREVLQLAQHGDVSLLKGVASPRKALVRKGMLTEEFVLTLHGCAQLDHEEAWQKPRPFLDVAALLGHDFHKFAHVGNNVAMNQGYGKLHWVGTHSADQRTAYAARRFADKAKDEHEVFAIKVSTIPSEYREFFGLKVYR